jgi:CSLREA domain-containing protein
VEDGSGQGGGAATVAQLNDDTYFDFTATLVNASQIDSAIELASYDVVVLGDAGDASNDWTEPMSAALRTWVETGGGLVGAGWLNGVLAAETPSIVANLNPILPGQNTTFNVSQGSESLNIVNSSHPVTAGLSDFAPNGSLTETTPSPLEANDTALATISGRPDQIAVAVKEAIGSGRSVYLGPIYMGSTEGGTTTALRSGSADRLLEQAVSWAANVDPTGAAALVVTTKADTVAEDGVISLREAINYANTNPGSDLIRFNLPVGERVGNFWTIQPTTQLTLTDPGTQILGSTQSGFTKRNPVVVLDGTLAPAGTSGVLVTTSNCYVSSLRITGFTGGDPAANGIRVTGAGSLNNTFWGNLISGNAGIAIDLGGDGITANDGGDSDSGANNLQNTPVITSVERNGGNVIIIATLTSQANTSYSFEFFSAAAAGPGGRGVSEAFLGGKSALNDSSGVATVSLTVPYDAARTFFSATCTDMTTVLGNTSEFSDAVQPSATPDTTAPTVTISSPVRNSTAVPSAITGTASDDRGVQKVQVTLRRGKDGYYWNGTAFVSGQFFLSTNYTVGATSGNWSVTNTLPTAGQLGEDTYLVAAYATDRAGNSSNSNVTSFFTLYIAPNVDVTTPAHNSTVSTLPGISGTASDTSGVQSVQVSLMRSSDNKYWSGSGWGASQVFLPTNYTAGATSGNWSITGTLPSGGELNHQRYYLRPRATDIYGFATTGKTSFVYYPAPLAPSPHFASTLTVGHRPMGYFWIRFTGPLHSSSADPARYQVRLNGAQVPFDLVDHNTSTNEINFRLNRSLASGNTIRVDYDLVDTLNRSVKGNISGNVP